MIDPTAPRWIWDQSAGVLVAPDGKRAGGGYSGRGDAINDGAMQHVRGKGPIPRGLWTIGRPRRSVRTGAFVLDLTPLPGTETHGRSAFQIHGDNSLLNRTASSGCIILARPVREAIAKSGIRLLEVIA